MGNPHNHFYEFDQFRINAGERVLLREGTPVTLPPKVFDTLIALVERHGHIVEKDELIQRVWPETFVEENNLSQYVSAIRKTLGDGRRQQRYIETVPRRGYRFTANVREVWDEQEEIVRVSHTKVSLKIQEESEIADVPATVSSKAPQNIIAAKGTIFAVSGLLVMFAVLFVASRVRQSGKGVVAVPQIKSLAVLPLNSGSGNDQFLGLSIADDLVNRFGQTLNIKIRPTSAVYKYLGTGTDPVAAGRQLQVDAVFAGEAQKTGDRISVTLRLINTLDGAIVFEKRIESDLKSFFSLQDTIIDKTAREVFSLPASSLKSALSRRHTLSLEAHEAYVRGRYYWNNRTAEGLHRSMAFFEQAIRHDSNYALAFAGLADAYAFDNGLWRLAEGTARKALALDAALGQAHATIGFVRWFWLWDWQGADSEFKLAVALSPEYATAHQWYALFLLARYYPREARTEMNRALEIDPFSLSINADLGQVFYFMEDYDAAIEQCRRTLALDPNFINAYAYLYQAYTQKGLYADALDAYFKVSEITNHPGFDAKRAATLRAAYDAGGMRAFWQKKLKLDESFPPGIRDPYDDAEYHARLGDKEQALRALGRGVEVRSPSMVFARVNPVFKDLYKDPRFLTLIERVGKISRKESNSTAAAL